MRADAAAIAAIATFVLWLGTGSVATPQGASTRVENAQETRSTYANGVRTYIFYRFLADQPAPYGEGVTSNRLGSEVNAHADRKINHNFTASLAGGVADRGEALRQTTGRTANPVLGLLYLAYSY
jgi:hypothetical protein